MRITPNFNFYTKSNRQNVQFGHVYSSAIDKLRSESDGYGFKYMYDGYDDYNEYPEMLEFYIVRPGQNKIIQMTNAQVQKLEELTKTAASLKKSIITGYKEYCCCCYINEGLSLLAKDEKGDRKTVSKVEFKTGDIEYNLSQFEAIVEQAKLLEADDSFREITPNLGQEKYVMIDKYRNEPRFQSIYNYTICNYGGRDDN